MLKAHAKRINTLSVAFDVLVSGLVYSVLVTHSQLGAPQELLGADAVELLLIGFAASVGWPVVLEQFGLYGSNRRSSFRSLLARYFIAGFVSTLLVGVGVFATRAPVGQMFPVAFGYAQFFALSSARLLVLACLRILRKSGRNYRNALIIGSGPRARMLRDVIERHPEWGTRIAAYVDDSDVAVDPLLGVERVHKFVEIPSLLREHSVSEVILACPRSMLALAAPAAEVCAASGVPFTLLSDVYGDSFPPPRVTEFDSLSGLSFAPVHHSRLNLAVKRAIDLVGATMLLVVSAPVLAVAAVVIRLSSPGPAIFRQQRCGAYGRTFEMLKLRTMCVDAESQKSGLLERNEMDGPVFKIADDPRITRVGGFLRRWSLDELPQLWNVIRGDMSLVGPRPPVPLEVAEYETGERRRLSMRPGLTCIWQVNGRNAIGFDDWVKLDVEYIDTWSLMNDFKLLLKTIPAVIRGNGAS